MQQSALTSLLGFLLIAAEATQAAVLSSPTPSSTPTMSTSIASSPSTTSTAAPIVIAGNCDQNTLQFCCPLIVPTPGEGSVEFAGACMQGNLPASYDCFYAFESICCGGSPDANGNTCQIVPPVGNICSPGAAGTIESPCALVGASTVTESVDCTSTSSVAASTSVS